MKKESTAAKAEPQKKLPPGQVLTKKWPVLTYGAYPEVEPKDWRLRIFGLVEEERTVTWEDLTGLPVTKITCDMHCVTRWSKLDNKFEGARMRDVLDTVKLKPEARFMMVHCFGGYTSNLPLEDLMGDDVLLAYTYEGKPLEREHGGPCRLLVPKLYLWKSAKWIKALELMHQDRAGFWERAGYHMYGDPWKEQRHGWNL